MAMTPEEIDHAITVMQAKVARCCPARGDLKALEACIRSHGVDCADPLCELAWLPPTA